MRPRFRFRQCLERLRFTVTAATLKTEVQVPSVPERLRFTVRYKDKKRSTVNALRGSVEKPVVNIA